jgi:hypothetical protein
MGNPFGFIGTTLLELRYVNASRCGNYVVGTLKIVLELNLFLFTQPTPSPLVVTFAQHA